MTAVGLLLMIAGFFTVRIFGSPYMFRTNAADYIGVLCTLIGAILAAAGVFKLAWSYLP